LFFQMGERDAIAFDAGEAILFRFTIHGFLRFGSKTKESASDDVMRGWREDGCGVGHIEMWPTMVTDSTSQKKLSVLI
jgi:hypothetical protein